MNMMGFRPVRYQQGGNVSESRLSAKDVNTLVNDLVSLMRDGTSSDVRTYTNMNRSSLETIAGMDIGPANIVRNVLSQFPQQQEQPTQPTQPMPDLGPGFDPQAGTSFLLKLEHMAALCR